MTATSTPSDSYFLGNHPLDHFRGRPFPFEALPDALRDYVYFISDLHGCNPSAIALASLTLLCNTHAASTYVPASDEVSISTRLLTCISTTDPPAATLAIERMIRPMLALQSNRVQEASSRTEADYQAIRDEPIYPSDWDPLKSIENLERERAIKIVAMKYPMFIAHRPSIAELKRCISKSFDHSMSVVSERLLDELRFPANAGQYQQRDLYCSLVQEGFIELPTRWRRSSNQMVQSQVGLLMTCSHEALDHATHLPLGAVTEVLGRCVLYHAPKEPYSGSLNHAMRSSETEWTMAIQACLEARCSSYRKPEHRLTEHDEDFALWERALLSDKYYRTLLNRHASLFADLPRRIVATLIDAYRHYDPSDWCFKIAEWMLAQTLLVTVDARWQRPIHFQQLPEQIMLEKIRMMQPVKFWKLRRAYNRQTRFQHEHVLSALLRQNLVRYNENRELEAAP